MRRYHECMVCLVQKNILCLALFFLGYANSSSWFCGISLHLYFTNTEAFVMVLYWPSANEITLKIKGKSIWITITSNTKARTMCIFPGMYSQIAKFMGPTWGPPGSCRPQMGPMLAPWTLLPGLYCELDTCPQYSLVLSHLVSHPKYHCRP